MTITIYHNPKCGTSRNTLAMIEQSGAMLDVIDYQKTPIGRAKLVEVIAATGLSVRDILRQRGTPYDELDLGNEKWSDDQLIDFIVEHPILMNRPIVVSPKGAVLARPSEKVLDILPNPDIGSFTKEDGDVVK
ncbi:MAG: arsenate reductase (glutaredoxin) [Hyphomicrobiales bacterium]